MNVRLYCQPDLPANQACDGEGGASGGTSDQSGLEGAAHWPRSREMPLYKAENQQGEERESD
jgi:hypothetical protein